MTPATFITIPLSHFCEKARWALDRCEFPYREEPHAPLFHLLVVRRKSDGAVPVLVDGTKRLSDSTDILKHADAFRGGDVLYPLDPTLRSEVEALEDRFDTGLGLHARRWAYGHLLTDPKLVSEVWSRGISRLQAALVPVVAPLVRRLVRSGYRISPEGTERSLMQVRQCFQEVGERLRSGRRFLAGERFTAGDLTFAALAAPLLFPPECRAAHPALEAVPPPMREEVLRLRDTPAGKFGLRLFAEERAWVMNR